jgi:hypothetical protein
MMQTEITREKLELVHRYGREDSTYGKKCHQWDSKHLQEAYNLGWNQMPIDYDALLGQVRIDRALEEQDLAIEQTKALLNEIKGWLNTRGH